MAAQPESHAVKRTVISLLLAGMSVATSAYGNQAEHVNATHAWVRLLPGDLPAGGYVILQNMADKPAMLVSASSGDYADVMLHQSTMESSGMSQMTMVDRLDIPARGTTVLAPAGYHLMLTNATRALKPGNVVDVKFHFADGSVLDAHFLVRPANALSD
jgi:copper(I)-binding protein